MTLAMELNSLPIIDWELGTKLAGGKKEFAEEILNLLIRTLPDEVAHINLLNEKQNYPELLQYVHKLHGAVSYCGTPRLKIILKHLESQLKNNIMDDLLTSLHQLNIEVNRLLEFYPRPHI